MSRFFKLRDCSDVRRTSLVIEGRLVGLFAAFYLVCGGGDLLGSCHREVAQSEADSKIPGWLQSIPMDDHSSAKLFPHIYVQLLALAHSWPAGLFDKAHGDRARLLNGVKAYEQHLTAFRTRLSDIASRVPASTESEARWKLLDALRSLELLFDVERTARSHLPKKEQDVRKLISDIRGGREVKSVAGLRQMANLPRLWLWSFLVGMRFAGFYGVYVPAGDLPKMLSDGHFMDSRPPVHFRKNLGIVILNSETRVLSMGFFKWRDGIFGDDTHSSTWSAEVANCARARREMSDYARAANWRVEGFLVVTAGATELAVREIERNGLKLYPF